METLLFFINFNPLNKISKLIQYNPQFIFLIFFCSSLQSLYSILASNVKVKEFFDKEVAFDVMMSDVYKIIGESMKDILE